MAISRKPKPAASEGASVDIDALIHKGGSVAGEGSSTGKQKLIPVMLRLPPAMLEKVDASVQTRVVPTARTTWIMEAIAEKLEREGE
ncbi:MAG: hypothetical protein KDF64_02925 [Geminicoccaceae bacterium]|nr:hypothetical protein [Geminicoccaceae bacterium]